MIGAWRKELLLVAGVAALLWIIGRAIGQPGPLLAAGLIGYLGWHIFNLVLLQLWLRRRRSARLPLSWGVWEAAFDGLQQVQSQHRRRRGRLTRALAEFRAAAAGLPDALVVLDETNCIRWTNPAATRLLGADRRVHLGSDIRDLLRHPILEDDLAAPGASRPLEIPSPANGAWMLSVQVTRVLGDRRDGQRVLVARDVTSIYKFDRARRDFVANVSHELRTPITVFRGFLETLRDMSDGNIEWARPVALMDREAAKMQNLVGDLLTLSRLEMADRPKSDQPVPVANMLAEICADARSLSGADSHRLVLDADPGLWLRGDRQELQSAFSNLVFNAVKHTPPGTTIDVRWDAYADGAALAVRDTGHGIAAHHLPRLTERFYQVDTGRARRNGGTGLGLAIVKQVLEHYRGELRIASREGEGSAFTCTFPNAVVEVDQAASRSLERVCA
ncbi:MAG: phosphate regulon sensor histidine kinase PhoR [Alphaproteobacteria bacterium]|nr:phosphate regulon sensor histidine kinase PhoR [Alphaproteobacteria bacterium]